MSARERSRRLGAHGPVVFPLSLGCIGMCATYGPADEDEVRRLEEAVPASAVAGARYDERGMRTLDSEG
jgi:hypothetical protein